MRYDRIARATLAITALFVLAAIAFAGGARLFADGASSVAGDGAAQFGNRCARCHDAGDFAAWARTHPDAVERGQWLADVLESHFPPPEEERRAIIEHIQQVIVEPVS